jgi:hypothetical protein
MDAYYAILHILRAFMQDQHRLLVQESMQPLVLDLANDTDAQLREEFARIQWMIDTILFQDVLKRGGIFHQTKPLSKGNMETILRISRDVRPFNSLKGYLPFLPQQNWL